jgi:uncharacterized membrane protein YeaQ/YmgE (transglycosylase-associated protein family)
LLENNLTSNKVVVMGIISWIVFGAIAGWLASLLSGTKKGKGCFFNIILGVVGAFLGGAIFKFLGGEGITGFNIWSLLVAVIGSMLLLWFVRKIRDDK